MTKRLIWLKVLLVMWILTGMLWFGFTLPNWEESEVQHETEAGLEGSNVLPSMVLSKPESSSIYLSKLESSALKSLVDSLMWGNKSLNLTGYYTGEESSSIGLGRAKEFKAILSKHGNLDDRITMRSEKKDNLILRDDFLHQVIGMEIRESSNEERYAPFSITFEVLENEVLNSEKCSAEFEKANRYLNLHNRGNISIVLKGPKSSEAVSEYRTFIQEVKNQITALGAPNFKLIGDSRIGDSELYELEITYN